LCALRDAGAVHAALARRKARSGAWHPRAASPRGNGTGSHGPWRRHHRAIPRTPG